MLIKRVRRRGSRDEVGFVLAVGGGPEWFTQSAGNWELLVFCLRLAGTPDFAWHSNEGK